MAIFPTDEKSNIIHGPGVVWFDVPIPEPYTDVILDQEGRPTTGGVLLGYTRAGWSWSTIIAKPAEESYAGQNALQVVAPVAMTISGDLASLRNLDIQQYLMPAATLRGTTSRTMSFGAARRPAKVPSVLAVFRQADQRNPVIKPPPKQYGYVMIYECINVAELAWTVTRLDYASANFTFQGRAIMTRPPEDQIGAVRTYATPEL